MTKHDQSQHDMQNPALPDSAKDNNGSKSIWKIRIKTAMQTSRCEARNIANVTFQNIQHWTTSLWLEGQRRFCLWRLHRLKIVVGRQMHDAGLGNEGLREQISELDRSIEQVKADKTLVRQATRYRQVLVVQLVDTVPETSSGPVVAEAQLLKSLNRQLENLENAQRERKIMPGPSRDNWARIGIGYGTIMLLVILGFGWFVSGKPNQPTENGVASEFTDGNLMQREMADDGQDERKSTCNEPETQSNAVASKSPIGMTKFPKRPFPNVNHHVWTALEYAAEAVRDADYNRRILYFNIASSYKKVGDVKHYNQFLSLGMHELSEEEFTDSKIDALSLLARVQRESGSIDDWQKTTDLMQEVVSGPCLFTDRCRGLLILACEQAQQGKFPSYSSTMDAAIDALKRCATTNSFSSLASQVAEASANAGEYNRAKAALDMVSGDIFARIYALNAIAEAQARRGDDDLALKTARLLPGPDHQGYALAQIAIIQADAGRAEMALTTARSILELAEGRLVRLDDAPLICARALLNVGESLQKNNNQTTARAARLLAMKVVGNQKETININPDMSPDHLAEEACNLAVYAEIKHLKGDRKGFAETVDKSEQSLKGIPSTSPAHWRGLGWVIVACVRCGEIELAMRLAADQENPISRSQAYIAIANTPQRK